MILSTSTPKVYLAVYSSHRVMSAVIASASVVDNRRGVDIEDTVANLDLPDVVKAAVKSNLKSYLEAIKIDGYEGKKKRKVFVFGNTGRQ